MANTYDLIVRGGEVVNHAGRGMADVGVRDGRIEFVGDLSQASAGQTVDATGLTVLVTALLYPVAHQLIDRFEDADVRFR